MAFFFLGEGGTGMHLFTRPNTLQIYKIPLYQGPKLSNYKE